MRPRYLLSSTFIHISFLAFLFLFQRLKPPSPGPSLIIDGFDYLTIGEGGHGNRGGGGGPTMKQRGQIVLKPPIMKIPKKLGPLQHGTTPDDVWNPHHSNPPSTMKTKETSGPTVPGSKTQEEQSPVTRVGISAETKAGNGGDILGDGEGGFGNGVGVGIGDGDGNGFGFGGYLRIVRQRIWSEWSQSMIYGSGESCVIGLTVYKDGAVSDVQLEKPSSNSIFNEIAMRAIRHASPMPPLPTEFSPAKQRFRIHFMLME